MLKKIFNYLRPSFEGTDNKFSFRRATAFVALILIAHVVGVQKVTTDIGFKVLVSLEIFLLALMGLVNFEQIIRFKNGTEKKEAEG